MQTIWRNVQRLGLNHIYTHDHSIQLVIKQLMAIGFLPFEQINIDIEELIRPLHEINNIQLDGLFEYFRRYWLERIPLIIWNIYKIDEKQIIIVKISIVNSTGW